MIKQTLFITTLFCLFNISSNAQSFELLDSNDVNISGTTYYVYGSNQNIHHTKFNIKNLTNSNKEFKIKARQEYSPYPQSNLMFCIGLNCFSASTYSFSDQIINYLYPIAIPANSNFDSNLDIRPATWMWTDCPNDSSIWNVIVYNVSDTTDSTSTRIIYRCSDPLATNIEHSLKANTPRPFPNPTNSILNFKSNITGRIFNVLGDEVLQFNNKSKINISHLAEGLYFLKTNNTTIKIIKE